MKWEPADCLPGDMIRIQLGKLCHFGIFVSEDEVIQFGLPPTAANRSTEGEVKVIATDIDTFACGCIVERACLDKNEAKRRLSPEATVAKARSRIGEGGYNIIHNNCEHFVNECVFGESRCTQEEDVRRRWQNRPVCDVYLAVITDCPDINEIFPEKRRAEISRIRSDRERNEALFCWKLLAAGAKHSFNTDLQSAGLRRKLGGKWVCDSFFFSISVYEDIAAVAVSNAPVDLKLGRNSGSRIIRQPDISAEASGKNCTNVRFFRVAEGASSIMGNNSFI